MMTERAKEDLWLLCDKFINDQRISCAETVYQSDRVIENAYQLIEDICDIVGYAKDDYVEDD